MPHCETAQLCSPSWSLHHPCRARLRAATSHVDCARHTMHLAPLAPHLRLLSSSHPAFPSVPLVRGIGSYSVSCGDGEVALQPSK